MSEAADHGEVADPDGSVSPPEDAPAWFAVRTVVEWAGPSRRKERVYEERITLWRAASFDEAIARAEAEVDDYLNPEESEHGPVCFLGLLQAFRLSDWDEPGDGIEVFSLIRESDLDPDTYVSRFFDTGEEYGGGAT